MNPGSSRGRPFNYPYHMKSILNFRGNKKLKTGYKSLIKILHSGMSFGYVHFQLSSPALVHCEGRNALERVGILKHNSQQGLSLLESLKLKNGCASLLLSESSRLFQLFKKPKFSHSIPLTYKNSCGGLTLQFKLGFSSRHLNHFQAVVTKCDYPQNTDFPRYYSKKEKKPFPIPIIELRRAARQRFKNSKDQRSGIPPPKRGLLVQRLIPVAYSVMNARIKLINNLKKLLKVVPVHGCKWCSEIHVGPVGHPFKSCTGPQSSARRGHHEWGETVLEDILIPVDAYHLYDRLGKRIPHEERFSVPRIPAVVELCIQAGVDLPEYPTKRRRKPIIRIGKKEFVDADESDLPDLDPEVPKTTILDEIPDSAIIPPSSKEETILLAVETLQAWEEMREGAMRLVKMYPVRACGYCPEVHVGPTGHKAQNCGAHKHQQRNGQHGWQASVLDDLIPPKFVWHVPDVEKPLQRELRNFYGQAPAVVEICAQAGADVPDQYKATMRLDIGIPTDVREAEMVV